MPGVNLLLAGSWRGLEDAGVAESAGGEGQGGGYVQHGRSPHHMMDKKYQALLSSLPNEGSQTT